VVWGGKTHLRFAAEFVALRRQLSTESSADHMQV
jgi:hypothetical protein